MPKKIAFATSNWKDRPNKPEEFSQAEWDAYNSSKFNGFPFPTIEKAQDNQPFEQWDKETYYQGVPSKSEEKMISVLGDHYVKFTFAQLIKLHWRMKGGSFEITHVNCKEPHRFCEEERADFPGSISHSSSQNIQGENENTPSNNNSIQFLASTTFSEGSDPVTQTISFSSKDDEALLFQGRSVNFNGSGLGFSISTAQPVLKMGEDDYRVFFSCEECKNIEGVCENFAGSGALPAQCGFDENGYSLEYAPCYSLDAPFKSTPYSDAECQEITGKIPGETSYMTYASTESSCLGQGTSSTDTEQNKTYVAKNDLACYGCYERCSDDYPDKFYFYYIMCEDDPEQNCGTVSFAEYCHDSSGAASSPNLSFIGEGFYNVCIGDYPTDAAC